jgi:predicted AAA+ superfamily ATPase
LLTKSFYLNKIRPFYHSDLIKSLVGILNGGKTSILTQIIDELKNSGIESSHIIYFDIKVLQTKEFYNPFTFNTMIKSKMIDNDKYYLFFDEIQ